MNEILLSNNNHLFLENDKFIVDNMLTDEDLDLELGSNIWQELCSSDSNSSSLNSIELSNNISLEQLNSLTPPETPTSSDSGSVSDTSELSPRSPLSTLINSHQQTQTHTQPTPQVLNYSLSNVTLLPAMVNLCPPVVSPVAPYIPNAVNMMPINSQFNNNNNSNNKLQLSQLKREARKLRNREAASISRKRKKDYVDNLQSHVNVLVKENSDLKHENEKLKCKITDLEKQNRELMKQNSSNFYLSSNCKTTAFNNNKKAALSLLAVVFMLGLNLKPFTIFLTHDKTINGINFDAKQDLVRQKQVHGASRSLLMINDNDIDANVPIDVISAKDRNYNSSNIKHNCKTYINQTESLRMESELRGFMLRLNMEKEEVKQKKKMKIKKSNILKERNNKPFSIPRLKAWMQRQAEADINDLNDNQLNLFQSKSRYALKYEDLLSAIHRRDDTFYFLSYSYGDHLIIPPIANNGTEIRPRFSILMPSFNTLNESSRGTNITYHQIAMMQIDCEVINTKIVQLDNIILSDSKSDGHSMPKIPERTHNRKPSQHNNTRQTNRSKTSE